MTDIFVGSYFDAKRLGADHMVSVVAGRNWQKQKSTEEAVGGGRGGRVFLAGVTLVEVWFLPVLLVILHRWLVGFLTINRLPSQLFLARLLVFYILLFFFEAPLFFFEADDAH